MNEEKEASLPFSFHRRKQLSLCATMMKVVLMCYKQSW